MASVWAELRRRNVFRVAAAYAVVGWLIIQVVSALSAPLNLPEWFEAVTVTLLAIGFPIALLFAWAFDLTPDGIRLTQRDDAATKESGGNKLDYALIGGLLVVAAVTLWGQLPTASVNDLTQSFEMEEAPSIAVLPFVDMSPNGDQEYFGDGIAEELLNELTRLDGLRVAGRTSSFSFKQSDENLQAIGEALHVNFILEGSIRKDGDRVLITAQLINAADGYHLWSDTYARELTDIFAIQEEIAIAVVSNLKITLLGDVPKTRKTDPQAYQLFLEGQYLKYQITADSMSKAIEAFKQVVEIDPAYVPAWASLADSYMWLGENDLADQAIQIAISADPSYAYSYYVRGIVRIFSEFRFKEGIEDFQLALKLDPNHAFIVASIGKGASITGKYDVAIEQFQAGLRLEPVTPEFYFFLGMTYRGSGRLDDSEASYRKMLSLSPQYRRGHFRLWHTLFLKGEFDAALAELEQETSASHKTTGLAITHYALGNEAQSDEILADLIEDAATRNGYRVAMVYGYRGEVDKAFEWLNQALETEAGGMVWILGETAFHGLHSDPRWQPLLENVNLLEYWLEMPPEWGGPQ